LPAAARTWEPLTRQTRALIGCSVHCGEIGAGWRYLDYKFKSSKIQDMNFSGPQIGVAWR